MHLEIVFADFVQQIRPIPVHRQAASMIRFETAKPCFVAESEFFLCALLRLGFGHWLLQEGIVG